MIDSINNTYGLPADQADEEKKKQGWKYKSSDALKNALNPATPASPDGTSDSSTDTDATETQAPAQAPTPKAPPITSDVADKTLQQISSNKTAPVSPKEADGIIVELKKLDDDYKADMTAPSYDRTKLEDALNHARELRDTQTNRNDWLEVAQTLSRAVAQFGASQSGMSHEGRYGRDNSGLNFGPGVDFERRNQRAMQEYQQTAKEQGDLANLDRESDKDSNSQAKEDYMSNRDRLQDALKLAESRERQKADQDLYNLREQRQDAKDQGKDDKYLLRENLKDTRTEIDKLSDKDRNLRAAIGVMLRDDLSSKADDKNKEKIDKLAADAGITSTQLINATDTANKDMPGTAAQVWGKVTGDPIDMDANRKKREQSIYQALGSDTKARLDALVAKKARMLKGDTNPDTNPDSDSSQTPPPVVQSNTGATAATETDPKVSTYAKEHGIKYARAADILSKRGYVPK